MKEQPKRTKIVKTQIPLKSVEYFLTVISEQTPLAHALKPQYKSTNSH